MSVPISKVCGPNNSGSVHAQVRPIAFLIDARRVPPNSNRPYLVSLTPAPGAHQQRRTG
jgi:hypothetical protein